MAIGKKITQLDPETEENVSNDTLIYIVNNGVSRKISLDNLIFDGFITALKLGEDAVVSGKIKSDEIEARHLKAGIIEASKLKITGDGAITPDSIGAAAANDLANAIIDIQSTENNISSLQGSVSNLEAATADGGINTFYQSTSPFNASLGDIWFDETDNKLYRWNGASWDEITDPDIATAVANAAAAANVADKKITTYFSDDAPTVDLIDGTALNADDEGDLWFDTNDGNRLYRWDGSVWVEATDNRVATLATQMGTAVSDISTLQTEMSDLQAAEDGGINTFYQSDEPSAGLDLGDLWVDTDDNRLYRYNGVSFDEIQDTAIQTAITNAAAAANLADKKITTYYGPDAPTVDLIDSTALDADDTGDLWFETDNNNKLHRWDGSAWISVTDGRVDTISTDLGSAVTNISTLEDRADGFVHTFFQDNQPTNADVATGNLQTGDLWIDTNDGNKLYRFNGSTFDAVQDTAIQTAISDAANAANVADNKITTYYGDNPPTTDSIDGTALSTEDEGDLWFETDNNNKLHRWSGSEWVAVADSRIDSILTDLGNAVTDITTLQGGTDGFVHTFYQGSMPTNSDLSGGGTIGVGDLWIDTNNNNTLKRYNGTGWDLVADQNIQTAISNAAAAANIADNKITTYYGPDAPTVDSIDGTTLNVEDEGDLWFESDQNNKLHRWNGAAWVTVHDSRVDTLASDMATAQSNITTLEAKADGVVHTFYQDNEPTDSDVSDGTLHVGDLWIDKNDKNKLYRYNGSTFVEIRDDDIATAIANAASAANIADNKITTYYAPNPPSTDAIDGTALDEDDEGDLWFETDNFNKLYRWSGSAWQTVKDTSVEDNIYTSGTTTIDGGKITTGSITADRIESNTITASSGIIASAAITDAMIENINASKINAGEIDTSRLKIDNVTLDTDGSGNLIVGVFDAVDHISSGTIGIVGGIAGESSEANNQEIDVFEIHRSIFGKNGYPMHIAGDTDVTAQPAIYPGTVLGDYKNGGSGVSAHQQANQINNNVPLFKFNFTTGNYTGTKMHLIQCGIDFNGSSQTGSQTSESNFAVAMRQTNNPGAFRSTNANDYVFTDRKSGSGSHSISGTRVITSSANLTGNTEYYIWCFGQGDDGVSGYQSGFINVFGLNV